MKINFFFFNLGGRGPWVVFILVWQAEIFSVLYYVFELNILSNAQRTPGNNVVSSNVPSY
jgi:hypothetical protein